jgi:hypothetical protein
MITDTGKNIIGKYLLGQAPAFASYIAVGCGSKPLLTADPYGDYSEKTSLDFEMFRVPISSRGFVNEEGVSKLVLTAELPTEERYEISEIGIFSAGSNSAAGSYDSKTVLAFTQTENWQYHTSLATTAIETITTPLDEEDDSIISTESSVFQTNADNSIFYKTDRAERYERCRFLNNIILINGSDANLTKSVSLTTVSGNGTAITYTTSKEHNLTVGDTVTITGVNPVNYNITGAVATVPSPTTFTLLSNQIGTYVSGGSSTVEHFYIESGSNHIHLSGTKVNFNQNSPADELKLAFSVVNKEGSSAASPDIVRVLVEFASSDSEDGEYARFEANIVKGTNPGQYDLTNNRYCLVTKQLQQLYTTPNFSWDSVNIIKIYASAFVSNTLSDDFYIALDAMRLENVATTNPIYGLTGYSVIKNTDATTVIKPPNSTNYVEFRFSIGVT